MIKPLRLITVTREDLSNGYQTVQSAHAVAEFAIRKPLTFLRWRLCGNFLISLAVKDANALDDLMKTLDAERVSYVKFFEPDINEVTAITIAPSSRANEVTKRLSLAGRNAGLKNKHNGSNQGRSN